MSVAAVASFHLFNTRLCFVASHLAAHQEQVAQRNSDTYQIISSLRMGDTTLDLVTSFTTASGAKVVCFVYVDVSCPDCMCDGFNCTFIGEITLICLFVCLSARKTVSVSGNPIFALICRAAVVDMAIADSTGDAPLHTLPRKKAQTRASCCFAVMFILLLFCLCIVVHLLIFRPCVCVFISPLLFVDIDAGISH